MHMYSYDNRKNCFRIAVTRGVPPLDVFTPSPLPSLISHPHSPQPSPSTRHRSFIPFSTPQPLIHLLSFTPLIIPSFTPSPPQRSSYLRPLSHSSLTPSPSHPLDHPLTYSLPNPLTHSSPFFHPLNYPPPSPPQRSSYTLSLIPHPLTHTPPHPHTHSITPSTPHPLTS